MKDFNVCKRNMIKVAKEINDHGYINQEIDQIKEKDIDILILSEDEQRISFYGETR